MSITLHDLKHTIENDESLLQAFSSLGISNPVQHILQELEKKKTDIEIDWTHFPNSHRGIRLPPQFTFFPHQVYLIEKLLYREQHPFHGITGGIVPLPMGRGKTLIAVSVVMCLDSS